MKHVYDQKNIRRRVYDALNVLMAMNIISKEKKEIKWIGLPTNSAQECQNLEVRPPFFGGTFYSQSSASQRRLCRQVERQRRLERIKQKQSQLQELILQVSAGVPGRSHTGAVRRQWRRFTSPVVRLVLQQIAFKNLVQRNRQTEQQANRPPPPNSIIHLPFIIVNTSKKTVIDCSISSDKYDSSPS